MRFIVLLLCLVGISSQVQGEHLAQKLRNALSRFAPHIEDEVHQTNNAQTGSTWFNPATENHRAWDLDLDKCHDDPKWCANPNKELQLPGNGASMFTLDTPNCADLAKALSDPDAATKFVTPKWLSMGQKFTRDVACGYSDEKGKMALERCQLTYSSNCRQNKLQNHPNWFSKRKCLKDCGDKVSAALLLRAVMSWGSRLAHWVRGAWEGSLSIAR